MGRSVDWFGSRKAIETSLPVPKLLTYHGANSVSVSWEMRRDCLSVRTRLPRLAECEAFFCRSCRVLRLSGEGECNLFFPGVTYAHT